jgi:HK97 gp10 family phage protein
MARFTRKTIKVEGLKELEEALYELPRATGGNVLKRAILMPAQAFADAASEIAPEDTGNLKKEIKPGKPRIITAGKAAFAAAMSSGASRAEAGQAARAANSAAGGAGRHAVVDVGPTQKAYYGQFQEFGTAHHAAQPFMRPTWDRMSNVLIDMVAATLAEEIEKARQRIAKKAERLAAKIAAGK